jgi:hypothetical protein
MKLVKIFVCLFSAVLLSACGPSNPLIGNWEVNMNAMGLGNMGMATPNIEFTSSSMKQMDIETKVKSYKVEKGKVGVVLEANNQEATVWFEIVDENTITQDMGLMKITYRRVGSESKAANNNDGKAKPNQQSAQKPVEHALPQADEKTPLQNYVPITDGNDIMYAYYALSIIPVPYESIAEHTSADYRATTDVFKKQDILKAIQASIDAKVTEKKGRYFIYELNNIVLGHYDLASKAFPINAFNKDRYYYFNNNSEFKVGFTNPEPFNQLKVEDANSARALEEMVTQGKLSDRVKVYLYAQEDDLNNHLVKAQIVNVIISDRQGNQIVKFRQ